MLLSRDLYSGAESDRHHVFVQVKAPVAAIMAADAIIGINATVGIGTVAADDGAAGIAACALHIKYGAGNSPQIPDVVVQVVGVAALWKFVLVILITRMNIRHIQRGYRGGQVT
jgi:hypothetical protein